MATYFYKFFNIKKVPEKQGISTDFEVLNIFNSLYYYYYKLIINI